MRKIRSALKSWISRRAGVVVAILALFLLTAATAPRPSLQPSHANGITTLRHDPRFVLGVVADRMGVELSPDIPAPAVLLESRTMPRRWRAAAERHWRMRPAAFTAFYTPERNEIYLIDQAALHERRGGTLDDALAHELAHYLQARYRREALHTDWAELEAVQIQRWFRAEYMQADLGALRAELMMRRAAP